MKIGVFDSGVGGITVLNELTLRLPHSHFIYFGDTANVPYGTKSNTQIQSLVASAAERMLPHHLNALVIACNTAASLARSDFQKALPGLPLIDAVEAGVRASLHTLETHPSAPMLILGTRATVSSHIYQKLLHAANPNLQVIEQECPLLVPMIEEGWIDHPILHATVETYTKPYRELRPGIALLACTHYPWIKNAFQKALPGWIVLDSARAVTEILTERLPTISHVLSRGGLHIDWYFSDPTSVSKNLLQIPLNHLHKF